MSDDPKRDPMQAYHDACMANLGHLMEVHDTPRCMLFKEETADVQATHKSKEAYIRSCLQALQ